MSTVPRVFMQVEIKMHFLDHKNVKLWTPKRQNPVIEKKITASYINVNQHYLFLEWLKICISLSYIKGTYTSIWLLLSSAGENYKYEYIKIPVLNFHYIYTSSKNRKTRPSMNGAMLNGCERSFKVKHPIRRCGISRATLQTIINTGVTVISVGSKWRAGRRTSLLTQ